MGNEGMVRARFMSTRDADTHAPPRPATTNGSDVDLGDGQRERDRLRELQDLSVAPLKSSSFNLPQREEGENDVDLPDVDGHRRGLQDAIAVEVRDGPNANKHRLLAGTNATEHRSLGLPESPAAASTETLPPRAPL